ncbi:hypothetical protein BT96DRAFT_633689 [Gymnopus androsaceus JB14]|uniref:Uncharacterized protein n=1 Tax=Gymnopus androsaceus JB14 TaxID=1447944 RepID=A0A6A4HTU4_9AGAR|nr:hypothetical protein BT96DRAFT_633689 [Gymnopus androsaceus JB14]
MSADSSRRVITFLPPPLKVTPKAPSESRYMSPDVRDVAMHEDHSPLDNQDMDMDHESPQRIPPGQVDHRAYIHENPSTPIRDTVEPRLPFQPYPSPQSRLTPGDGTLTESPKCLGNFTGLASGDRRSSGRFLYLSSTVPSNVGSASSVARRRSIRAG